MKALEAFKTRQITKQMALRRRQFNSRHNKYSCGCAGRNGNFNSRYLVMVRNGDHLQTFCCGSFDNAVRGSRCVLNVVASHVAMDVKVGTEETCATRK